MITDFHSHVLPGMDDGAKTPEEAVRILRKMKETGVERVMLTPHFYRRRETIEAFLSRREEAVSILLSAIRKEEPVSVSGADNPKTAENSFAGIGGPESAFPYLGLGAEIAFGSRTGEEAELERLCYTGTKTLLIEMPFSPWTRFEYDALEHISLNRGFGIVLAHVERYPETQKDAEIFEEIRELPLKMQINAESLLPFLKRERWISFFREGRAELLGSDCHGFTHRPPNLMEGRNILGKKLGAEALLCIDREGDRILGKG